VGRHEVAVRCWAGWGEVRQAPMAGWWQLVAETGGGGRGVETGAAGAQQGVYAYV